MGDYNPHIPQILGQEWVPIRNEDTTFSPSVNSVELGHDFATVVPHTIRDMRLYANTTAAGITTDQYFTTAIYPTDVTDQSGPIGKVIIPCTSGGITGTGISLVGGATSVADALANGSDLKWVGAVYSGGLQYLDMYFGVNRYSTILSGKRILDVRLLYTAYGTPTSMFTDFDTPDTNVYINQVNIGGSVLFGPLTGPDVVDRQLGTVNAIDFGDIDHFWNPAVSPANTSERLPWRYTDLQRFEPSASNRLTTLMLFQLGDPTAVLVVTYAALEVTYCVEKRLIVGGGVGGNFGTNIFPARDITTFAADPSLVSGVYSVTAAGNNAGDIGNGRWRRSQYPKLNALRELYSIPPHRGIQVDIPSAEGQTFTQQTTHVLPQISIHTSGGPLTEVHVYGRQAAAQVYHNVSPTQEIYDAGLTPASYPQVRYYARRFGDTTVPLLLSSPTISGSGQAVSVSPSEWDALDPIIDGWKEITLRFDTPPALGSGTNPQWIWSATTETAGNRWEVLGAVAPAITGIPGDLITFVSLPNQLGPATYGAPVSGAAINFAWIIGSIPQTFPLNPIDSDPAADAVLLFSQDPPAISGFSLSQANQPLSGIGLNCGVAPDFIPTAIDYNQLQWSINPSAVASDTFERSVSSGWGTADTGQTWSVTGTASNYSVSNGAGRVLVTSTAFRTANLSTFRAQNINVSGQIWTDTLPTGAYQAGGVAFRIQSATDYNFALLRFNPGSGNIFLEIYSAVASVLTLAGSIPMATLYVPGTKVNLAIQAQGPEVKAKAWLESETEPDFWMLQVAISANNSAGSVATKTFIQNASIAGVTLSYDNLVFSELAEGYTELQRMDDFTDWQSIMKSTNNLNVIFNDYEARIGLQSSYRIRHVNVYGFAGPWSATLTNTIPAPGVTATSLTATDHVLVFTTNSVQSGASNLAYSPGWEGEVNEDFNFPESAGQAYQTMYNRDFVTVFRPSERGGTNFSRTLLVQAAAIAPETLEDFTSLRNMAWADVPYICVRDEEGNRWFANVSVPSGNVLRDRRLYMAPVAIVEVTDTPTPVDP